MEKYALGEASCQRGGIIFLHPFLRRREKTHDRSRLFAGDDPDL